MLGFVDMMLTGRMKLTSQLQVLTQPLHYFSVVKWALLQILSLQKGALSLDCSVIRSCFEVWSALQPAFGMIREDNDA